MKGKHKAKKDRSRVKRGSREASRRETAKQQAEAAAKARQPGEI